MIEKDSFHVHQYPGKKIAFVDRTKMLECGQEDYFRKNYFKEKHVRLDPHPQKNQDRNLNLESNDFTETFH